MKELDHGSLYPLKKHPETACVAGGHSAKELASQILIRDLYNILIYGGYQVVIE
jgi:hypothetical protein